MTSAIDQSSPGSVLVDASTYDDPLMTSADRLAQAWSRTSESVSAAPPSPPGLRPFGLRFTVRPTGTVTPLPAGRYCQYRQIAVADDGTPWRHKITDMTMDTTGPSPDGTGNTGNEEWRPDFMSDEIGTTDR